MKKLKYEYECEKDRCKWAVLDATGKKGICSWQNCPHRKPKSEKSYEIKWSSYYYKKCGKPKSASGRGNTSHWTTSKIEKLKKLYKNGESIDDIAFDLDFARSTIVKKIGELIKSGEIERRPKVQKKSFWQFDKIEKLKEMYEAGCTQGEMAIKLGTSKACVNQKIHYMRKTGKL